MMMELDGVKPCLGVRVFIAEGVRIIGDCHIGDDVGLWYNAVLRGDLEPIRVGARSNVQDGAVLHTDAGMPCDIGEDVTIGHGAIVHGAHVGDGALIGMGAIILSGATIGAGALVAAGSLVPEGRSIPEGWLAMGTPAKPIRPLTEDERTRARDGVLEYIKTKDRYLKQLEGKVI